MDNNLIIITPTHYIFLRIQTGYLNLLKNVTYENNKQAKIKYYIFCTTLTIGLSELSFY